MKRREKLIIPRYLCNVLIFAGSGASLMALTRSASGFIPCSSTVWPKKATSFMPNSHFARLITTPYLFKRSNKIRKCSRCYSSVSETTKKSSIYA